MHNMHNTLHSNERHHEVERSALLGDKDPEIRAQPPLCVSLESANYLQKNIDKFYDRHVMKVKATCFSYL